MKCIRVTVGLTALAGVMAAPAAAQDQSITVGWAAWDPANALVELSRGFTEETGIEVEFVFIPWPNFTAEVFNELNAGGGTFDVLIGDSQWIGAGAELGHYVQLNEFFDERGISMDDFLPATVYAYSTWPKGEPNYYALPAMGDALAWTYRRDWFERFGDEFEAEYGYPLDVPETWDQLRDIGTFFQGREIDGQTVYGMAINTERGSEGITMGVTAAMYAWDMQYENPENPYEIDGFFNAANVVEALEFYRELYECCTPPGWADAYMQENLDAYTSGQVAMQMNWYAFFPGISRHPEVGPVTGFFSNPGQVVDAATLGGQGMSVVSYSDNQDLALEYIAWFAQPEVQQRWWDLGGYSCHVDVLGSPDFLDSAVYAQGFLDSMQIVRDFWQEPAYADLMLAMQEHVHNYVVAGQGTAEEALDRVVEDWIEIFEDEGVL